MENKTAEQTVLHELMLAIGQRQELKIFRSNTGTGWQGKRKVIPGKPNDVYLENARPVHAGLFVGSSDLIGYTTVEVTPEMVGQKVAIFTAIEVKAKGKKASPEQQNFINAVKHAGGLAGVARKEADVLNIIDFVTNNNLHTDEATD